LNLGGVVKICGGKYNALEFFVMFVGSGGRLLVVGVRRAFFFEWFGSGLEKQITLLIRCGVGLGHVQWESIRTVLQVGYHLIDMDLEEKNTTVA
jgi:hypothetical protein